MTIREGDFRVRDVMSYPLITANSNETVSSVIRLMIDYKKGCVIICGEGLLKEIQGLVTNGMILKKIYIEGLDPSKTKVSDVMDLPPLIHIDPDAKLNYAISLMKRHNIRRLPVIKDQVLVGIVTLKDILKLL
jgi:CBS domain-containing protein